MAYNLPVTTKTNILRLTTYGFSLNLLFFLFLIYLFYFIHIHLTCEARLLLRQGNGYYHYVLQSVPMVDMGMEVPRGTSYINTRFLKYHNWDRYYFSQVQMEGDMRERKILQNLGLVNFGSNVQLMQLGQQWGLILCQ